MTKRKLTTAAVSRITQRGAPAASNGSTASCAEPAYLEQYGDDLASVAQFGTEVVTTLCEQLLAGGAPGLHFYTMNQVEPTRTLWNNLKLS